MAENTWYDEKKDGPSKEFLEWIFRDELIPDKEPGFYIPKKAVFLRYSILDKSSSNIEIVTNDAGGYTEVNISLKLNQKAMNRELKETEERK